MKIVLFGYGKMGKRIHELAEEANHEVTAIVDPHYENGFQGDVSEVLKKADVVIDFSHPDAIPEHLGLFLQTGTPAVIGTTGWELPKNFELTCKKENTAVLYGSNFSLGVQLFMKLAEEGAKLFGNNEMFHAALHELHHIHKVDAPSGTAKTLSKIWRNNSTRQKEEVFGVPATNAVDPDKLHVTAQRLGAVYGEHQIRVHSEFDDIEITHRARSRDGFASGAVKAAEWLANQKPGFYLIEDEILSVMNR